MISEITWDSEDGEPLIDAIVTSCVIHDGQMVILYSGRDRSTQQPYDGRLNLKLDRTSQTVTGSSQSYGGAVPFKLIGHFTDESFSTFEGRWIENDWTAKFYFQDVE
ncbi:MAG: hypothetical protein JWP34_1559 [Massilia sp.]|nr:hypothetical protein [Massilia sp.]